MEHVLCLLLIIHKGKGLCEGLCELVVCKKFSLRYLIRGMKTENTQERQAFRRAEGLLLKFSSSRQSDKPIIKHTYIKKESHAYKGTLSFCRTLIKSALKPFLYSFRRVSRSPHQRFKLPPQFVSFPRNFFESSLQVSKLTQKLFPPSL